MRTVWIVLGILLALLVVATLAFLWLGYALSSGDGESLWHWMQFGVHARIPT